MRPGFWLAIVIAVGLVACWRAPSGPALPTLTSNSLARSRGALPSGKITHVVFIVQENRTFDNIFGGPKPFPEASATDSGRTSDHETIKLAKIRLASYTGTEDPDNYHRDWMWACNPPRTPPPTYPPGGESPCRMDGFNIAATPSPGYTPPASVDSIYSYVDYGDTRPYWDIAREYSLGDHFFMGHNSESYTAHQYIFSAQSNNVVDSPDYNIEDYCGPYYYDCAFTPWGCDSPSSTSTFRLDPATGEESKKPIGPLPCFGPGGSHPEVKYPSLADRVDEKGLTWRLYAHSLCQSINALDVNATIRYGALWPSKPDMATCHHDEGGRATPVDTKNFRMPEYTFFGDIRNSRRELANVTWILPGLLTSDHPGVPFGWCGPSWVAKLVNSIGRSKYWDSTVVFVFWDDWGGYYDHVKPYVVRDAAGPGFRVPLLVVSPYAKRKHVAHTEIEFATLLKFTEETLGLRSLGATDASPYLHDLDDFFQSKPQPFATINPDEPTSCKVLDVKRSRASNSRWLRMVNGD